MLLKLRQLPIYVQNEMRTTECSATLLEKLEKIILWCSIMAQAPGAWVVVVDTARLYLIAHSTMAATVILEKVVLCDPGTVYVD